MAEKHQGQIEPKIIKETWPDNFLGSYIIEWVLGGFCAVVLIGGLIGWLLDAIK